MRTDEIIYCRTYQISKEECEGARESFPSPHYKHVIVCGAIERQLPEYYIEELYKVHVKSSTLSSTKTADA